VSVREEIVLGVRSMTKYENDRAVSDLEHAIQLSRERGPAMCRPKIKAAVLLVSTWEPRYGLIRCAIT
jgi:hypothetical protein